MLGVGWLIGGAVVGGLISAFSNGYQAYNSAKAQNEQIDYQKQQLEKQKDQLTTQYNNSVKWTNYQFGQSMSQGNSDAGTTPPRASGKKMRLSQLSPAMVLRMARAEKCLPPSRIFITLIT